jgi:hypothetical protein
MSEKEEPIDYSKPVAYDINGRPLYAHPPITEEKQSNHKTKTESDQSEISDATRLKHMKSLKVFPDLKLSEGDYVISSIRRHPIGLLVPFSIGVMFIALAFVAMFNYDLIVSMFQITGPMANNATIFWPVMIFTILVLLGEYIVYFVYSNNRFFLTNDSIIQQIQTGIFANSEHIISLGNVEDASYSQNGIIEQLFNYGSIRLSTEGDETTYKFTYVANPKECIITLDSAIENYKNCRKPC